MTPGSQSSPLAFASLGGLQDSDLRRRRNVVEGERRKHEIEGSDTKFARAVVGDDAVSRRDGSAARVIRSMSSETSTPITSKPSFFRKHDHLPVPRPKSSAFVPATCGQMMAGR